MENKNGSSSSEVARMMLDSTQAKKIVIDLLKDSRKDIRTGAAKAMGAAVRLNPHMFQDAIRKFTFVLFNSIFKTWGYVSDVGYRVAPGMRGDYSRDVLQEMTELLRSESPGVRQSAIGAISRLPLKSQAAQNLAFQTLTVGLRDDNPKVRKSAITSIYQFLSQHPDNQDRVEPLLEDCQKDPSRLVSNEATKVQKLLKRK